MANNYKEFSISHSKIEDSKTISTVQRNEFKKHGVDMSVNECPEHHDDFKRGVRIFKVKTPRKFFFMGKGRGRH
jgi:hypothetical protein